MHKKVSEAELAKHNKDDDAWISINDDVYNISRFAAMHPGVCTVGFESNID